MALDQRGRGFRSIHICHLQLVAWLAFRLVRLLPAALLSARWVGGQSDAGTDGRLDGVASNDLMLGPIQSDMETRGSGMRILLGVRRPKNVKPADSQKRAKTTTIISQQQSTDRRLPDNAAMRTLGLQQLRQQVAAAKHCRPPLLRCAVPLLPYALNDPKVLCEVVHAVQPRSFVEACCTTELIVIIVTVKHIELIRRRANDQHGLADELNQYTAKFMDVSLEMSFVSTLLRNIFLRGWTLGRLFHFEMNVDE